MIYRYGKDAAISELIGKTLVSCVQHGRDAITFETTTGERYQMVYHPDCCAQCQIEDVVGDLSDLVGTPIVMAEEATSNEGDRKDEYDDSFTWTFYKLATVKGYVTIRWYGASNGYYSETASFERV